jgi:addiction module HigA family antidote
MGNKRENKYMPDKVFPPGDTLSETLEEIGMSQAELAERMDVTPRHINSIIKGKAAISEDTALCLERVLGVPASFWQNLEQQYRKYRSFVDREQERERRGKGAQG